MALRVHQAQMTKGALLVVRIGDQLPAFTKLAEAFDGFSVVFTFRADKFDETAQLIRYTPALLRDNHIPQSCVVRLSRERAETRVKRPYVAEANGILITVINEGNLCLFFQRGHSADFGAIPLPIGKFR